MASVLRDHLGNSSEDKSSPPWARPRSFVSTDPCRLVSSQGRPKRQYPREPPSVYVPCVTMTRPGSAAGTNPQLEVAGNNTGQRHTRRVQPDPATLPHLTAAPPGVLKACAGGLAQGPSLPQLQEHPSLRPQAVGQNQSLQGTNQLQGGVEEYVGVWSARSASATCHCKKQYICTRSTLKQHGQAQTENKSLCLWVAIPTCLIHVSALLFLARGVLPDIFHCSGFPLNCRSFPVARSRVAPLFFTPRTIPCDTAKR